ncbi:hypothetical protein AcW1_005329 [Taiwanofungus camphoratus]|nr:hypothetical protein AcW2_004095 [Antrodia cinnamomea]KAI0948684.1 hypothetical protein AcV7_009357 [Antrodia cinnamomea]KAI0956715.1 hypothetical protein AcW1_005329 [Antrodia cinnamomea]KAI0956716.1 hypothetical protein AcW1_005329 [Antrodia cinnamomea]
MIMQSRSFLFLIAFLAFALCAIATPIPHDDAVIKKALKQYQIKRRDGSTPVKRQYDGFGKPSGWWVPAATNAPSKKNVIAV